MFRSIAQTPPATCSLVNACGLADDERYYREDAGAAIPKAKTNCVVLTDATFDKIVDGSANVLVEFYAPWYVRSTQHTQQINDAFFLHFHTGVAIASR